MDKVSFDAVSTTNQGMQNVDEAIFNYMGEVHNRTSSDISKEDRDFLLYTLQQLSHIASLNDHAQRSMLDACGLEHTNIDNREAVRRDAVFKEINQYREASDIEKSFRKKNYHHDSFLI